MNINKFALGAVALLFIGQASAHNRWILPSHFNLSNDKGEWVMVDVTASNETFNVDKPMGADRMKITGPNGKSVRPGSSYRGHRKSVVDIHLEQSGTYQLKMGGEPSYWTSYQLKGDDKKHWLRGVSKSQRQGQLPQGAINANTMESYANVLTYITLNTPTNSFKTTNKGLELVPVTHPSDVAQGEPAQFKFIFNGQPQAGVEVEMVREGVRYRNDPNALKLISDDNGIISFTLAHAGRYLLMAEHQSAVKNNPEADEVGGQIFLTFEAVLD